MGDWTFVTKYALVLASIAKNPDKTAREIGDDVGVTERTAHKIIVGDDNDQNGGNEHVWIHAESRTICNFSKKISTISCQNNAKCI